MTQLQRMDSEGRGRTLVKELNPVITCRLCEGYLIDATTLIDCLHCFCRACILRYFENSKVGCPVCNTLYKKKSQLCFRSDSQVQSLVYKLVPALYSKEIQRREDFYRSTGLRASSSCSDDSVIDRERDMINEQEKMISRCVGERNQFLGPDDPISLSLEYYQVHLDTTDVDKKPTPPPETFIPKTESDSKHLQNDKNGESENICNEQQDSVSSADLKSDEKSDICNNVHVEQKTNSDRENVPQTVEKENIRDCDKRFLQCPAAVSMKHLQKFIRMKYGLTGDHRVDIIYKGEVLPVDFSLIDVAYSYKWKRMKPMRFFYRIFTPMKVKPFKIVNTTLSTGGKQLQIVPVKSISEPPRQNDNEKQKAEKPENNNSQPNPFDQNEDQKKELFAHLQLQSKTQTVTEKQSAPEVPEKSQTKDCIFEYEEPEEEFAEKRDREWALQKKLDENRKREEEEQYSSHHFTKKRKKNKHSKNEFNVHKKRKLHAEIASNDAELKLKVKITNNGHKHKHHKSSGQTVEKVHSSDVSSKEKLLQMRQIRHKPLVNEDKNAQTLPSSVETVELNSTKEEKIVDNKEDTKKYVPKPLEDIKKLKIKVTEPSSKISECTVIPKYQNEPVNTTPKVGTFPEIKACFAVKPMIEKELNKKLPSVHIERSDSAEKQTQKAFLKPLPVNSEKSQKIERPHLPKMDDSKMKSLSSTKPHFKAEIRTENSKIKTTNKLLERQIANLQQHCTIEPKQPDGVDKRLTISNEKPKFLTPHYPPGFTVSKVEQGVKRKAEDDTINDKRPSLEITLISPPTPSPTLQSSKTLEKTIVKRPPPATIPLEKIKKSVHLKSAGISIIPKMANEKCDNIGALDLSKPSPKPAEITPKNPSATNGFNLPTNRQLNALPKSSSAATSEKTMGLSNLHMLSKVATEHSTLNKSSPNNNPNMNKPRPQMPSLQTIKIPNVQNQNQNKVQNVNLQKIPKLNEIPKFRPNMPIRSVRPNQNQNIRNIPNPSLLIRQQNQNRLNSQITAQPPGNSDNPPLKSTPAPATSSTSVQKEPTTTILPSLKIMDSKLQEKKEISV